MGLHRPDHDGCLDGLHPFDTSVWERFWAKVSVRGVDECWEWIGGKHTQGYGQMSVYGRAFRAHRMIGAALVGRHLRATECACHHCDNPPCVNPKHIFVGTALDNARDMLRKGRNANGGKTRIERIRAAVGRRERRLDWARSQSRARLRFREQFETDFLDADIEDAIVSCDVEATGVECEPRPDLDEILDRAYATAALQVALSDLRPTYRAVMSLRLQNFTLEECGQRLGLTRERCRQIEELSIAKLQKHRRIAAIVNGRPAPPPVPASLIERLTLREKAAEVNAQIAAFFARRTQPGDDLKARRRRMKRAARYRSKVEHARGKVETARGGGCSFCGASDHRAPTCMKKWRADRRSEQRAA